MTKAEAAYNSLLVLINEAYKLSPQFRAKWDYWTVHRSNKQVDRRWLLRQLEDALGKPRLREAAVDLNQTYLRIDGGL